MRDEAKHTASHQAFLAWAFEDAKLRLKPVKFVSAGFIEPLKDGLLPKDSSGLSLDRKSSVDAIENAGGSSQLLGAANPGDGTKDIAARPVEDKAIDGVGQIKTEIATVPADGLDRPSIGEGDKVEELFFFDLAEDEPTINLSITPPKIASPMSSCAESDSSEDIIVFKGRTAQSRKPILKNEDPPGVTPGPPEEHNNRDSEAMLNRYEKGNSRNTRSPTQVSRERPEPRRKRFPTRREMKYAEEDAILEDYIANITANSDDDLFANQFQTLSSHRDLGGDDDDINFGTTDEKSPKDDNPLDEEELARSDSNDTGTIDSVESNDDQDMDANIRHETLGSPFAEQGELGTGSEDLLLLENFFASTVTRKSKKAVIRAASSRAQREPPSATQVADAFDCLDLADWDHLCGQTRKRRSKQPPNFNVSDPDIEAVLKAAWQQDRERKKTRKQERETLRSQGLLGKEANPDDLRVKYPSGMKLDDIKLELTAFLVGTAER